MTYNSNAIEGNSLKLKETFLVINEGITVKGKPLRDHLEAKDHYAALEYLYDLVDKDRKHTIAEMLIKNLHQIILQETDKEWAGRYRNANVIISGASILLRTRWKKDRVQGLKSKGLCGAKKRLTKEKLRKIEAALLKGPEKNGFTSPLWTLERVARVAKRETRVSYHPGHIWKILHSMGWTNQKPVRRARERNETAIRRWYKEEWPALKKRGSHPERPLVFMTKRDSPTQR